MKQGIFMLLLIFSIACTTKVKHQKEVKLITKDTALIENFKQVKLLADSIIFEIFDDRDALSYLNISYGFEYDGWIKNINDSLDHKPKLYWFTCDLLLDNDTIHGGRIEIDSLKMIKYCFLHDFVGLKKLHEKELKIGLSKAKSIALKNGLAPEKLKLDFNVNEEIDGFNLNHSGFTRLLKRTNFSKDVYFWDAANYCDGCPKIHINAKDGSVFARFTIKQHY